MAATTKIEVLGSPVGILKSPVHCYPVNDSRPHVTSITCECMPMPLDGDEHVIVHNSFDGREAFEIWPSTLIEQ